MRLPLPNPTMFACDYAVAPGSHCKYKCPGCGAPTYAADSACPAVCSAVFPGLPPHDYGSDPHVFPHPIPGAKFHEFSIEDELRVPSDLPPGEYVLGWRWDCEMSSQVWNSCADISIV